jgi:hypothetical protein
MKIAIFLASRSRGNPGPHTLSGADMISNTFRHSTPSNAQHLGLRRGTAGAMGPPTLPHSLSHNTQYTAVYVNLFQLSALHLWARKHFRLLRPGNPRTPQSISRPSPCQPRLRRRLMISADAS